MNRGFLSEAPRGTSRTLQLMAVPESLTDVIARELYELSPISGVLASEFIFALRQTDIIEPRNSEWSFDSRVRSELLRTEIESPDLIKRAHETLLKYTLNQDPSLAGTVIPNYLFTAAGKAYHSAGVGRLPEALEAYRQAAVGEYGGQQWLAAKLAREQIEAGILSEDETEILFLRAIVLFREGKKQAAEPLFWRIIEKDGTDLPTAFALNVVANRLLKDDPKRAENLLKRGAEVSREIGDEHGEAIAYHLIGRAIAYDRRRNIEAEDFFGRSISLFELKGNMHAAGQVLHSFGDFLAHVPGRAEDAEKQLRLSLQYLEDTSDKSGVGQTLNSLAKLISRSKGYTQEAESMLKRSIVIAKQEGDMSGLSRRYYSLGRLLASEPKRWPEAADAYRESIRLSLEFGFNPEGVSLIRRLMAEIGADPNS